MNDSSLLLVEGKDDFHVLNAIFKQHKIPETFSIKPPEEKGEGVDAILKNLPVYLRDSTIQRLGVIVDADMDIDARWDSIRNILLKAGYESVTEKPNQDGTIVHNTDEDKLIDPTVGIWIMPDNHLPGILENFIQFLVPQKNELLDYAKRCVNDIPGDTLFNDNNWAKAEIHTWLAWQEEPGTPLGQAITKRYLDSDCDYTQPLLGWVRQMFLEDFTATL